MGCTSRGVGAPHQCPLGVGSKRCLCCLMLTCTHSNDATHSFRYGQFAPGKPRSSKGAARGMQGGGGGGGRGDDMPDSAFDRERYFQQGLDAIAAIPNLTSVAFPYLVGCGLAGGKWKSYTAMLNAFAEQVAPSATVYIVRLPISTGAGSKTNTKKAAGKSRKGGGSGGDDPVMQQPPKKPSQPGQRAPPPRLLILLDMNGTVLLRNKTRVKGL